MKRNFISCNIEEKNKILDHKRIININKGITLISLVITIILLIILSGIVINLSIEKNGILSKAKLAKQNIQEASAREKLEMVLLEIQQEKQNNNSINEESIIEYINKNNMTINNDIVEVDGWKFRIEKETIKIVENLGISNEIITIGLNIEVGTSTCTINVNSSSKEGEIVNYKYKLNKEIEKQTTQDTITVENLEPETEYTIIVSVTDKRGNTKNSKPTKIITKPRKYIIKDGIPEIEGTSNGYASGEQKNGFFQIQTWHKSGETNRSGYGFLYDLSKYKSVKGDIEVPTKDAFPTLSFSIFNSITKDMMDCTIIDGDYISATIDQGNTYCKRDIYNLNIKELKSNYYITIYHNWAEGNITTNIYNLWLEE